MIFNKPTIVVAFVATTFVLASSSSLYEVTIKDFEPMVKGDTKYINIDKLKIKRVNRTHPHVIIGELEVFEDLGNDVEVFGQLHKQQGYEFRPTPFKVKYQYCDFIANEKVFYPTVLPYSDFVQPGTCPCPAGVYHVYGYYFNVDEVVVPPNFESGEYMIYSTLSRNGTFMNGAKFFFTLVSKSPIAGK